MFTSKKEVAELKQDIKNLTSSLNELANFVFKQQEEINELKKPKEPEYFG